MDRSPPLYAWPRTESGRCSFVRTREHALFREFCDAVAHYRYIGVCVGPPGVGKTVSALRYSGWDLLESCFPRRAWDGTAPPEAASLSAVLYTPTVVNRPQQVARDIFAATSRLNHLVDSALRAAALDAANRSWTEAEETKLASEGEEHCSLVIVDEADRLKTAALEELRDVYDRYGFGMVLVGMPGLEKTLARYPQLYSRVGFVHRFSALKIEEARRVIEEHRAELGIELPKGALSDEAAVAAVVRMSGGNFRLIRRLLQQIERVMHVNALSVVSEEVVEVARESLVIGTS